VSGRYGTSNLPDKHSEALEALRQRDPEATAVAIREDIEQGLKLMTQALNA
jgi:DNA-binding GntR family transcriptional regulator